MQKRLIAVIASAAGFYLLNYILTVLNFNQNTITLIFIIIFAILAYAFRGYLFTIAALLLVRSGKDDKAEGFYKKAYFANPKNALLCTNYGICLTREGHGAEAIEVLKHVLTLKPTDMIKKNAYLSLGSAYWLAGDLDNAIATFEELRSLYSYVNSTVLTTLGFIYLLKEDYEKATEITKLALEESAELASAWDNLGQIAYQQGKLDEAKANFQKAVENNPNIIDSMFYLGEIYEKEGDDEKAKEYFSKVSGLKLSALNTVSQKQVDEKNAKYGL